MSAKVFGKVWELEIDPIEKLVLLALADHADHEGNNVRPGNKLLCAKTGLSERTIGLKIADFIKQGILLPVRTTTGRGNIREFAMDVDAIPRNKYFIEKDRLKVEARSTFKPQERSKPDQPLDSLLLDIKVEADDIKVEVDGSPYKEGTVMNLYIGDTHVPQTPSEVNFPKAENLLVASSEIPSPEIVEPSLTNSPNVDSQEKPAAQPKAKRARKPQVDSGEGKASTPAPKTQGSPVSASPSAHQVMMATLAEVTGQPIVTGAAQGSAIKKILKYYTAEQGIEVLHWMADPKTNWRGKVDWLAVQNFIPEYFRRKAQQPLPQEPKPNGFSTTKTRDFSRIIANLPEHLR